MNVPIQFGARMTPGVKQLLAITLGAYVCQLLLPPGFTAWLALSLPGLQQGMIWQPATYMFLHDPSQPLHLVMNLLVLFFLGPDVERRLGGRRFVILYLACGVLGGLGWVLLSASPAAFCLGASGAIFGVLGAYAALDPDRPLTVLLFFVFPVTMRAWVLAVGLGVLELLFLQADPGGHVARTAHLAGGVAGFIAARWFLVGAAGLARDLRNILYRLRPPRLRVISPERMHPGAREEEQDRILDKIAAHGVGSLTQTEREFLEHASRSRRGR